MIDERQEEFASLYALDLLEGAERADFETALTRDPELRQRVRELRETAAQLAQAAPAAEPPPALKQRVLRSARKPAAIVPFPTLIAWAAAAGFAVAAVWLGQLYLTARSETAIVRDQQRLADLELRTVRNQLEAERIVDQREISETRQQLAGTAGLLARSRRQVAALGQKLQEKDDFAQYKLAALGSMIGDSPKALAVAVWCPSMQEGILAVSNLPALPSGKDYQLWVMDPQYPTPVNGGVFGVDPATGEARLNFKTNRPVKSIARFAVSLERKGGVAKAEGPIVLLSDPL